MSDDTKPANFVNLHFDRQTSAQVYLRVIGLHVGNSRRVQVGAAASSAALYAIVGGEAEQCQKAERPRRLRQQIGME